MSKELNDVTMDVVAEVSETATNAGSDIVDLVPTDMDYSVTESNGKLNAGAIAVIGVGAVAIGAGIVKIVKTIKKRRAAKMEVVDADGDDEFIDEDEFEDAEIAEELEKETIKQKAAKVKAKAKAKVKKESVEEAEETEE
jgi:hypothetical protein